MPLTFHLGTTSPPAILVTIAAYAYPDRADSGDGNWLSARIEIHAGPFHGAYEATLRTEEIHGFRDQLGVLYESLNGRASYRSMEDWLTIDLVGDGKGHVRAACVASDAPGRAGNCVSFAIDMDQTELPEIIRELDDLASAFPVRGA